MLSDSAAFALHTAMTKDMSEPDEAASRIDRGIQAADCSAQKFSRIVRSEEANTTNIKERKSQWLGNVSRIIHWGTASPRNNSIFTISSRTKLLCIRYSLLHRSSLLSRTCSEMRGPSISTRTDSISSQPPKRLGNRKPTHSD